MRRRALPLSLMALVIPAAVVAVPVVSSPTPTAHPVAPRTYHLPVPSSALPSSAASSGLAAYT